MKLHLVGGFLGSGKTTAIIQAAKLLMGQGQRVGVITNDQGRYLVDTAFFRLSAVPALEVTGGCFCCNYDDLNERLAELVSIARPDVIFAESVGSCADLVATVVRPLLSLRPDGLAPSSFSVFTDIRLLRRRLLGDEMPFSEDVVYIFDKQIEEAGLLVVNKTDLTSARQIEETKALFAQRYPEKACLFQCALNADGILPWLRHIQSGVLAQTGPALEIDYARYGAGEAKLAWVDESIALRFPPGQGRVGLQQILRRVVEQITRRGAGIGHLKFIVTDASGGTKISFPAVAGPGDFEQFPEVVGDAADLLVNARVEMPAEELQSLLHAAIEESGAGYTIQSQSAFHPPQPSPTHRMGEL